MDNIIHFYPPPDFVIEFFVTFSRFEYALKRLGFLEKREDVKVKWNDFADKIESKFDARLKDKNFEHLREAVDYLIKQPPRNLVKNAEGFKPNLCWKISDPSQGSLIRNVLILAGRVRNNLFHGEKPSVVVGGSYETAKNHDADRDEKLIRHSLVIIETCINIDPDVYNIVTDYVRTPYCENSEKS